LTILRPGSLPTCLSNFSGLSRSFLDQVKA
jgi:hypothetical protein